MCVNFKTLRNVAPKGEAPGVPGVPGVPGASEEEPTEALSFNAFILASYGSSNFLALDESQPRKWQVKLAGSAPAET